MGWRHAVRALEVEGGGGGLGDRRLLQAGLQCRQQGAGEQGVGFGFLHRGAAAVVPQREGLVQGGVQAGARLWAQVYG